MWNKLTKGVNESINEAISATGTGAKSALKDVANKIINSRNQKDVALAEIQAKRQKQLLIGGGVAAAVLAFILIKK